MAAIIKIQVETSGGLSEVKKDLDDLSSHAKDSGSGFNALQEIATGALRAVGEAATGFALKGFQMLGDAISDGIADAQNNAKIQAQTAAVIKSTGEAAGVSAQHVADYASSLSDAAGASLFGDDQVQQSTNMLLTFTEIKGKVLDAATAITVDMAQALGGAPKDSAIQLGKALNDPIKGITALTRVGVTFTDEQKAQIQAMQEAGDMAGAQTVILNELNKEFGGSAKAAADATGGWSEFNGRMGEAKEALGAAVLPLLNNFAGILNTVVMPAIESFAQWFSSAQGDIGAFVNDGLDLLFASMDQLNEIWLSANEATSSWGELIGFVLDAVLGLQGQGVGPLQDAGDALSHVFNDQLVPAFDAVWTVIQTQVWPILQDLGTALFPLVSAAIQIFAGFWIDVLVPAIQMLWGILTTVLLPVIAALAGWLRDNLPGAIQAVADFLTGTLFPALHTVYDFISVNVIPILQLVAQWLIENVPIAIQTATDFFNNTLLPALNAVWAFISTNVIPIILEVVQWLQVNVPAALQTAADFWNNVLLPALNAVWSFLNTYVIPLIRALIAVELALLGAAVRLLAQIWMTVLLPALTSIWTFIQNTLGPVFGWLNTNILMPLFQTLQNIAFFVLGALKPYMEQVAQVISGAVSSAFGHLANVAGDVRGALKSIGDAVQSVIGWLNDLISKLNSVSIPDWLEGHSPPPMADWFSYIGGAVQALNEQLPALQANLTAQIGPQGQSITNTASTRSFTYAPNINTTGNVSAPMDLALASSLASV